jgi:DNA repair protein RadC
MFEYIVTRRRCAAVGSVPARACARSSDVAAAFAAWADALDRESFVVVLLDGKNRPLGFRTVSVGILTASLVHPREVFSVAVSERAAAVVLLHNHPSGDATPSAEDHGITRRLCEAGDLLGIRVLDHLVLGAEGKYFSFADEGVLGGGTGRRAAA